jgi:hypothetical protein
MLRGPFSDSDTDTNRIQYDMIFWAEESTLFAREMSYPACFMDRHRRWYPPSANSKPGGQENTASHHHSSFLRRTVVLWFGPLASLCWALDATADRVRDPGKGSKESSTPSILCATWCATRTPAPSEASVKRRTHYLHRYIVSMHTAWRRPC